MKVVFFLFLFQITFVQPQGLTIPFTTLSCKTDPLESKPLTISFAPIEKAEHTAIPSVESFKLKECSAILDVTKTMTGSYKEKEATYISKIQKLNPNIAISSHISKLPDIKLCSLNNNNKETIARDILSNSHNIPLVVPYIAKKDCIPTKEIAISINPALEPIYFQTLPANTMTVNSDAKGTNVVYNNYEDKSNCYINSEVTSSPGFILGSQYSIHSNMNNAYESQKGAVVTKDSEKNKDYLVSITQPCKISDKPCENTATSSVVDNHSTDKKVLYPLSNIKFCLGTDTEPDNKMYDFLKTNTGNILAMFLEKKSDNPKCKTNSELHVVSSADKLNFPLISNPNNKNCKDVNNSIYNKTPPPTCKYVPITSISQYSVEQPSISIPNNLITKCFSSSTKAAIPNSSVVTVTDTHTDYLSSSLNRIIPTLTTNILPSHLENDFSIKLKEDVDSLMYSPRETLEMNRLSIDNNIHYLSPRHPELHIPHIMSECTSIPPCIECPATMSNAKVELLDNDLIKKTNCNVMLRDDSVDKICTIPTSIPYLASITINVTPSNEAPNNIVILI